MPRFDPNGGTAAVIARIGLLAFAGSTITVENSVFTVINRTQIGTGIYAVSSATVRARNVEVGHGAVGGWAPHAYNTSRIERAG